MFSILHFAQAPLDLPIRDFFILYFVQSHPDLLIRHFFIIFSITLHTEGSRFSDWRLFWYDISREVVQISQTETTLLLFNTLDHQISHLCKRLFFENNFQARSSIYYHIFLLCLALFDFMPMQVSESLWTKHKLRCPIFQ